MSWQCENVLATHTVARKLQIDDGNTEYTATGY